MHMGKDNPGVGVESCAGARPANGVAQYLDLSHQQIRATASRFTVKKKVPPGIRLRR
jgi:hypothetical protein